MPKDLNEAINTIFRGVVFIFYNYFYSLARMAVRPALGGFKLVRRLRSSSTDQVRPYVFVFLSFFRVSCNSKIPRQHFAVLPGQRLSALKQVGYRAPKCIRASPADLRSEVCAGHYAGLHHDERDIGWDRDRLRCGNDTQGHSKNINETCVALHCGAAGNPADDRNRGGFLVFQGVGVEFVEPIRAITIRGDLSRGAFRDVGARARMGIGRQLGNMPRRSSVAYGLLQPAYLLYALFSRPRPAFVARRVSPILIAPMAVLLAAATFGYYQAGNWLADQIKPAKADDPEVSGVSCTLTDDKKLLATAIVQSDRPLAAY